MKMMSHYTVKIEAEYDIIAKDDDEAASIADEQVRQMNEEYTFETRVKEVKRATP